MGSPEPTPATSLARELGLYSVFTVSIGAMVGSGIFVLPGIATKVAGPAVIAAYFLAGLVVLPAALSKSEMATAMPQAGGTYLFVDRAMGPLMGTIAGFGTWFAMVFKAAFALVGLGAYVHFFIGEVPIRPLALGIAAALTILNAIGIRQSARLQALLVTCVLGVLVFFIADGITLVDSANYRPFLEQGTFGLLEATGLVFVAYAGVTKVASVAEEVRNPSRNLPLGILISIGLMMLIYPAVVLVMVGTTPAAELSGSLTPMATSAEAFMQDFGPNFIAAAALLALVSMANAGLLASSRYPFAMARNHLAPRALAHIGVRSGTPTISIAVTGLGVLVLIAFVPLIELAKLASAFQLLVLSMANLALIAFRESNLAWYRPPFRSPLYPWIQLLGIAAAGVLITQMGVVPLLGAIAIVVGGIAWFHVFGKRRSGRESASLDAIRLRATTRLIAETSDALERAGKARILIPVSTRTPASRLRDLIGIADSVVRDGEKVEVLRFETIPSQMELSLVADDDDDEGREFDMAVLAIAEELGARVQVGRVLGHDRRRALMNHVDEHGIDLVLAEMPRPTIGSRLLLGELRWMRNEMGADTAFLRNKPVGDLASITVMGAGGPFDALKVQIADRLATANGGSIRFLHAVQPNVPEMQLEAIREYHAQLVSLCTAEASSLVIHSDDVVAAMTANARDADLVIMGASLRRFGFFVDLADSIAERLDCSVLLMSANDTARRTVLARIMARLIY